MFAAQLLEPSSVSPAWAAVSLGLIGGAYVLSIVPPQVRRVLVALVLVAGVAGGLVFVSEASAMFGPLECCQSWLQLLGICLPPWLITC